MIGLLMLYFPLNLWDKKTVGNSTMDYARLHHIGPYTQEYATDYTEAYPDGEPGIEVGTTGATGEEKRPWLRGFLYFASVFGGGLAGYMMTTPNRVPSTKAGRQRKRKKELEGTLVGLMAGIATGIALDVYVVPLLLIHGTKD